jgi:hypothetical protein
MTKSKTHFPQVSVEIAKKVAKAESNGHASDLPKTLFKFKKSTNGHAPADHKADA